MTPAVLAILEQTHAAHMKRIRQLNTMAAAYGADPSSGSGGEDLDMARRITWAVRDAGFAGVADRLAMDMKREGAT